MLGRSGVPVTAASAATASVKRVPHAQQPARAECRTEEAKDQA